MPDDYSRERPPVFSTWAGEGVHQSHIITVIEWWNMRLENATVEFLPNNQIRVICGTSTVGRVRCSCAEEWSISGWPMEGVKPPPPVKRSLGWEPS